MARIDAGGIVYEIGFKADKARAESAAFESQVAQMKRRLETQPIKIPLAIDSSKFQAEIARQVAVATSARDQILRGINTSIGATAAVRPAAVPGLNFNDLLQRTKVMQGGDTTALLARGQAILDRPARNSDLSGVSVARGDGGKAALARGNRILLDDIARDAAKEFAGRGGKGPTGELRNMDDLLGRVGQKLGFSAEGAVRLGAALAIARAAAAGLKIVAEGIDLGRAIASGDTVQSEAARIQLRSSVTGLPVVGEAAESIGTVTSAIDPGAGLLRKGIARLFGKMTNEEDAEAIREQAKRDAELDKRQARIDATTQSRLTAENIARVTGRSLAKVGMSATEAGVFDAQANLDDFNRKLDTDKNRQQRKTATRDEIEAQTKLQQQVRQARDEDAKAIRVRATAAETETRVATLRGAGQGRAADRVALEAQLDAKFAAVPGSDARTQNATRAANRQTLANFDAETKKVASEFLNVSRTATAITNLRAGRRFDEADDLSTRESFRGRIDSAREQFGAGSAQERATIAERDAALSENVAKRKIRDEEIVARSQSSIREQSLRAAGRTYEADREKFVAEADAKIRAATTATEKQVAVAEKAAGEEARRAADTRELKDVRFSAEQIRLGTAGQGATAELRAIVKETQERVTAAGGNAELQAALKDEGKARLEAKSLDIDRAFATAQAGVFSGGSFRDLTAGDPTAGKETAAILKGNILTALKAIETNTGNISGTPRAGP